MDVVLRLRVLIWVLLLSLWGVMVYQFLGEEQSADQPMRQVSNPYSDLPPAPGPEERGQPEARAEPEAQLAAETPPSTVAMVRPPGSAPYEPSRSPSLMNVRAPLDVKGPADIRAGAAPATGSAPARTVASRRPPAPVPPGFIKLLTRHFTVYAEGDPASGEFLELLENLHGNLMLDLAPFSPWAKDDRVTLFLFKNQETYRRMTGRPAWSGGASSVPRRRIYLYESSELPGILAHELCHIYYDSFFTEELPNPLWLSEGMATLVQVERGLAAPNWLRENLERLERGGGYPLDELMRVTSTAGSPDARVRLWYAESYSVVRFLIRAQYRSSFYKFSRYLREGRSVAEALYRGYGMPYNRVKALEYAWRYEIGTNRLSRLLAGRTGQP
ncbi:MAG: hypothetical protein PHF00_13825 [Elusimicrobia bacterium]|nr:hypothetical protein [Elusimicrobiota bacterium]